MKCVLDWRSAGLACTSDPGWRSKIWQGGLILMLPIVGWPMVLGYRRLFVERVLDGARPLLPEWRGNRLTALRYGLGAMGVIHAWYLPLYLWLGLRTAEWGLWSDVPWIAALLVVSAFGIFSTLIIPAWLLWLRLAAETAVPQIELVLIGVAFAGVTFFIPAGFLNVARSRRIVTAFDIPSAVRHIATNPRAYVEAWLGSGVMSLLAHFSLPLAPWAVVWCYLAIIYSFSEVPVLDAGADHRRSWYRHYRDVHWAQFRVMRTRLVEHYEGGAEGNFKALCLGRLRIPLPRAGARPGGA